MSDLFAIGASATRAYGAAIRVVGENVANAGDPAYVRRRLVMNEAAVGGAGSPLYAARVNNDGVRVVGLERGADALIDQQLRAATTAASGATARANWLGEVESALADGPQGIGARMTNFFTAAIQASAAPASTPQRAAMLGALDSVATGFASANERLTVLAAGAADQLEASRASVNGDLGALATINRNLRGAVPGSAGQAQLLDQRDAALTRLAGALPVTISFGDHGMANVDLGALPLVDGISADSIASLAVSAGALAVTTASGGTTSISGGGALGGLASGIAGISAAQAALDTLASDFASAINGWNAGGTTPAGGTGGALIGGSTAATLVLLTDDPASIAAAQSGGAANANLLALDGLRGPAGGEQRWGALIQTIGQGVATALAESSAAGAIADQAASRRDAIAGVDLDQEAAEMLRLQQAYDAAARVLQVARETMQTIFAIF